MSAMLSHAQQAIVPVAILAKTAVLFKPSKRCANERSIASRQSIFSSLAYSVSEYLGVKHHQMIFGDKLKMGFTKALSPRDQAFSRVP
jgi:hypothetical protein